MKKGYKRVTAVSPHGAKAVVEGVCLVVAKHGSTTHVSAIDVEHPAGDVLVAYIPNTWALECEPNQ